MILVSGQLVRINWDLISLSLIRVRQLHMRDTSLASPPTPFDPPPLWPPPPPPSPSPCKKKWEYVKLYAAIHNESQLLILFTLWLFELSKTSTLSSSFCYQTHNIWASFEFAKSWSRSCNSSIILLKTIRAYWFKCQVVTTSSFQNYLLLKKRIFTLATSSSIIVDSV